MDEEKEVSPRSKKIQSAIECLKSLVEKKAFTAEQLEDLIELDLTVIEYLERRMGGSNIFTVGFILELRSLQEVKATRKTELEFSQSTPGTDLTRPVPTDDSE